jgi:predicted nucleic acid-binding protein
MILLDTSILSAVLRRRPATRLEQHLNERLHALLESGEKVGLPGLAFQEVLSGIRDDRQVRKIQSVLLEGYPLVLAALGDHLLAADIANRCRRKGITASSGDALVAALAINRNARLFAIDEDFEHIARAVPLRLVEI